MIVLVLIVIRIGIFLFGFPGGAHQSGPDHKDKGVAGEDGSCEDDHIDVSGEVADYHRELQLKKDKCCYSGVLLVGKNNSPLVLSHGRYPLIFLIKSLDFQAV